MFFVLKINNSGMMSKDRMGRAETNIWWVIIFSKLEKNGFYLFNLLIVIMAASWFFSTYALL
jgi:hypothetical protein